MGVGKAIIISFVSILLVLSLVALGILWSFQSFLYPQIYEHALNESGAYSNINVSEIPGGSFIKLPSGGVPGLVDIYLSNTLSYLRGDSKELNLTLEVDTSKLNDFLVKSAEKFPICSPGEMPFQGSTPVCRPANVNVSDYVGLVMEMTNLTIPANNQINLVKVFGINMSGMEQARGYVSTYKNFVYFAFALALVFTIIIFFVSDTRTRWSGLDFFLSGIAVLIVSGAFSGLPLEGITGNLSFLNGVISDLLNSLVSQMRTYAYVVGGLGIVMFVLSFFIKKKTEEKQTMKSSVKRVK